MVALWGLVENDDYFGVWAFLDERSECGSVAGNMVICPPHREKHYGKNDVFRDGSALNG